MRQAIRQPLVMTHVITLGFATALLSLFQPLPTVSAQQLTGTVIQTTDGMGTQGRRIENIPPNLLHPTKSLEKKDTQTLTNTPHRLIRKPQNAPIASVEPSPSSSSSLNSVPTSPTSLQSDTQASQSMGASSFNRTVGAAVPLATMSAAPSSVTTTGSIAVGATSTGVIPLAAAGAGNSSTAGNGSIGGRSMSRLAAEMPGLAQLITPPSAPVVPVNPAIGMSPTSLSFTAQQGGSNPFAQTVSISNTGGGTLSWNASASATWLSVSPASGTGNGPVTLTAATAGLSVGTQTATITLSAPGATTVTVPVSFIITAAPVPPAIGANPTNFSFTATQGGSNPATQTLSISNTGGGTLTWQANETTAWLSLSPASGTGNAAVTLSVATGTLTASTYSGLITLSATGASTVTIPVTFTVTAAPVPPAIGVSPTSFSFAATQSGNNPSNQMLSISNTGGGTLSWTASDNAAWLTLSPASSTGIGTVTLTVATGTLTAATYSGTITLSATGASSMTVPVTFTVATAPVPPAIGASPTSLSFAAMQGGANPVTQTVSISNTGGGTLSWNASPNTTWLAVSPASGTGNGTATVSVTTGILTAGSYTGNITLRATGASSVTVPVTFTVTSAPTISLSPTSLTYTAMQGETSPANQTVALTNAGGIVNWTVSDSASWLGVSPASGSSSSTLTAAVNTTGLIAGTYNGTITVSAPGSSSKTVAVTLTVSAPTTSSAILTWTPNTDSDGAGYKIYRATASGAYGAALAIVPAGTPSYQATGLSVNTTYFFVITAYDNAGNESSFSNEVSKSIF